MSPGLFEKFTIIRSVMENIYPITWWKTEESLHWIVTTKQANHITIICVSSAVWPSTTAATPKIWNGHEALLPTVLRSWSSQEKNISVTLSELDDLEKLLEVNIQVYNLAPTQDPR